MTFGEAIEALKQGKPVKRSIWQGYWFLHHVFGSPLIVAALRDNAGFAGAQPYQADLLATDWQLAFPEQHPQFLLHKLDATVYPSDERTISVKHDDTYGGAHTYGFQKSAGFENGATKYVDDYTFLSFVQKDTDGTMKPGILSEQLVLALIDRHKKLNAVFPSAQGEKGIAGLQQFLDAQKERVDERMSRGVMGELKK